MAVLLFMSTAASSIVNVLGAGSGVDMIKLASDLSAARFAAQTKQLQSRSEQLETRISAAATLKSQLSQLASALGDRVRAGGVVLSASISNPVIGKVDVAPGSKVEASFSLEVRALATHQALTSKPFTSPDAKVGTGDLVIRFGEVSAGSFAPDNSREPIILTLKADDSLTTLAAKIEAQGAGITAYVATTAAGAQLIMKGAEGAANGFTISAANSGADAKEGDLAYLNWSPQVDSGELKAAAADAAFLLDGVSMTNDSNRVADLPAGLSLTLTGTNMGVPARISFSANTNEISSVMKDMTAALNEVAAQLQNSARPLGGELGNDSGAKALKRALAALPGTVVMPNAAAGSPRTLSDLGLTLNRDGTFQLDAERLSRTLTAEPRAAAAMFTPGLYGVYATLDKLARNIGMATDPGSLGGSVARYRQQKERINERLDRLAEQQDALRAQLSKQFTQSDRRVSASQNTLAFLQNQIAVWNRSDR